VRNLRGEMQLSPGKKVPLVASGPAERINSFAPYLAWLGRLEKVEGVEDLAKARPVLRRPLPFVDEFRLMLEIEIEWQSRGTPEEGNRLHEAEVKNGEASGQQEFRRTRAAAVVEQMRERLAALRDKLVSCASSGAIAGG